MAIYVTAPDAETEEKKPEQSTVIQASERKTYTQEEMLALLAQLAQAQTQKGEENDTGYEV